MKKLIVKLISNSNEVSHKRVIALVSLLVLIVLAFFSAFGHTVDAKFIWTFASLSGGSSILTVIEKFTKTT